MSNINPDKKIDDYHSYFYNNQIEMTDFVKEKQEQKHQLYLQEKKTITGTITAKRITSSIIERTTTRARTAASIVGRTTIMGRAMG